jgi:hypothetical protein
MKDSKYSHTSFETIGEMPKSRRVATRIILGVWAVLAVVVLAMLVALFV